MKVSRVPDSVPERRRSLSWPKKIAFAAITTLAFFVLLEIVLRFAGVQAITQRGDPFVGFSRQVPLFVQTVTPEPNAEVSARAQMQTAPGKLVWFNPQSFRKQKPEGTRRIFCVGGSTTYGRPFADSTSYSGWLRRFLPLVDPSHQWEVINAGGVSYASYRVAALMEELAQYEPDLFIVLSGHNEFLERRTYSSMFERGARSLELDALMQKTRTWSVVSHLVGRSPNSEVDTREQLPEEVDEILNHSAGPKDYHRDDPWAEQVRRHYEFNLGRMVDIARDAGAEVVFLTPAANLRNCSPFKSEHVGDPELAGLLSETQRVELTSITELIEPLLREQRYEAALGLAQSLLESDPRDAMTQFLVGKSLFGIGQHEQAEQAFQRAIDEDICPLRATSTMVQTVRRVAAQNHATLVDFEARLRELSVQQEGHACFGSEYFLDHVHPTIDVHRRIALWIMDELQASLWLGGNALSESQILAVKQEVDAGIDQQVQGVAFRNLAKVLHWAGKFDEAEPRARDALRIMPRDLESRSVLADCMKQTGRTQEALAEYEALFRIGDFPRAHLPFGELLADQGRLIEAKGYLMRALLCERESHRVRAHYNLGLVHLQLREFDFAVQSLRESDRLFPNDPATIALIAEAELGRGQWEVSIQELQRVAAVAPDNFFAHYRLFEILSAHDRLSEAKHQLELAVQIEPENGPASLQLGKLRERLAEPAQ